MSAGADVPDVAPTVLEKLTQKPRVKDRGASLSQTATGLGREEEGEEEEGEEGEGVRGERGDGEESIEEDRIGRRLALEEQKGASATINIPRRNSRRKRAVSEGDGLSSRQLARRRRGRGTEDERQDSHEQIPLLLSGRGGIIGSEYGGRGEHITRRRGRGGSVVLEEILELLYDHTAPAPRNGGRGGAEEGEEPLLVSSSMP